MFRLTLGFVVASLFSISATADVFTVTKTADTNDAVCDVDCSLREAIEEANNNPGTDTIEFAVVGAGCDVDNVCTISPNTGLPSINEPVIIDGLSQPGSSCGGWPNVLKIVLDGSLSGIANGLTIFSGSSEVSGLVVHSFEGSGIFISNTGDSNTIFCNHIGTNAAATAALPNSFGIIAGSSGNRIGTTSGIVSNVISGNNGAGVQIDGPGNVVENNYIGLTGLGDSALANETGIIVFSGDAVVGGAGPESRNVISGNTIGEVLTAGGVSGISIRNNFIGTDRLGMSSLGAAIDGIVDGSVGCRIEENLIAGHADGRGIRLASSSSLAVIRGNRVGVDVTGNNTLGGDIVVVDGTGHQIGGLDPTDRNILHGLRVEGDGNLVQGNYSCLGADGQTFLTGCIDGLIVLGDNNMVGGNSPAARNVLTGSTIGLDASAVAPGGGNTIQGNYVCVDATGSVAVGNPQFGLISGHSLNNLIGGPGAGEGNLVSGCVNGVSVSDSATVQGNRIGTNALGTAAIPNEVGVTTQGSQILVGGTGPGMGNLISGNSSTGILVDFGGVAVIQGNLIGVDVSGSLPMPNGSGILVFREGGAIIGGTSPGAGNIISGNLRQGIDIVNLGGSVADNTILGNHIGVLADGLTPLGNGEEGIRIWASMENFPITGQIIGGADPGAGNIIGANGASGIAVIGSMVTGTVIEGNFIGTDASAELDLGNGGSGVMINAGVGQRIGGLDPAAGNTIANNLGQGVLVTQQGMVCTSKSILGNSIYGNGGLGIDLQASGEAEGQVTLNDPGDADSTAGGDGPNDLQNYPNLMTVQANEGQITVAGVLDSLPGQTYRIEVFAGELCNLSGHGGAGIFLGAFEVTTDGGGMVNFEQSLPAVVEDALVVAATATDSAGSTSEFSPCVSITGVPVIEVPSLGPVGLCLLAALLGVAGVVLRRRGV